jgi:RNA polymerase sigma-70 factor, ECF subfamily
VPTTPTETQGIQQTPSARGLLHIAGSPRAAKSESEEIAAAFQGAHRAAHPDAEVDTLELDPKPPAARNQADVGETRPATKTFRAAASARTAPRPVRARSTHLQVADSLAADYPAAGAPVAPSDSPAPPMAPPVGARPLDPERLGDHIDRLYRAACALTRSRDAAEDLVQDTYARVLARPRFLRRDDDLGYLLQTLRNTFLSTRRTAARQPITQPLHATAEPADERNGWRPERAAETHMVYAAIAELSDDFRDVLVAVDIAGLSYREAARALRVREATITTRLFRARQRVAQRLGNGDVLPSSLGSNLPTEHGPIGRESVKRPAAPPIKIFTGANR